MMPSFKQPISLFYSIYHHQSKVIAVILNNVFRQQQKNP